MTGVESTLNAKLAELLDKTRYNWTTKAEQTRELKGGGQVDVLIKEPGWPHVIVECKVGFKPEDVAKRFNNEFADGSVPTIVVEVKYDESLRTKENLKESNLHYCIHYDKYTRYPKSGWLTGTFRDLSIAIQYGRESLNYMKGVDILNTAIDTTSNIINNLSKSTKSSISGVLEQEQSLQTYAMASLTLSGALRFHDMVAEPHGIPVLGSIAFNGMIDNHNLLDAWDQILEINYYPIFSPARKILAFLPSEDAVTIINILNRANNKIISMNLGNSSDLHGQTFQKVISDRKKLAAFYTKPTAAALLASITIHDNWHNAESVRRLRIADFACGTGSLLQAAYKRVATNYEAASGHAMRDLHPDIMAKCIIGADVLPIATHLTVASLSSIYPKKTYQHTQIYQPVQGGAGHKIGSLEWIKGNATLDVTEYRLTGTGLSGEKEAPGHNSCDVVIMNPPYVRSTGPGRRVDQSDVRQIFTAFGVSDEDRRKMGNRATNLFSSTKSYCADKRAGLATFFMDLAHEMLRGGGWLGLILPMTAATGVNWRKFRNLIKTKYTDLVVIGGSFSSDTNMREIIISARKIRDNENPSGRGLFVMLNSSPKSTLDGLHIGLAIHNNIALKFEGPPQGGTTIKIGDERIGTMISCSIEYADWFVIDTSNIFLHQMVHHIRQNNLYLPRNFIPIPLETIPLREIVAIGPSHLQIRGGEARAGMSTSYSGPFNLLRRNDGGGTYPSLWNNNCKTQRQIIVSPDSSLEPRDNHNIEKVEKIWNTASHIHMNLEASTTTQSLMMAYTKNRVVGGRAWPSIITDTKYQKGLAVWCNSTLGILCRWSMSNHQQPGRSCSSRTAILDLPVPNKSLLMLLNDVFDEFSQKPFNQMKRLWKDETRIAMDDIMLERLGIKGVDLTNIRLQLCAESSINGGKISTDLKSKINNLNTIERLSS